MLADPTNPPFDDDLMVPLFRNKAHFVRCMMTNGCAYFIVYKTIHGEYRMTPPLRERPPRNAFPADVCCGYIIRVTPKNAA